MATGQLLQLPASTRPRLPIRQRTRFTPFVLESNRHYLTTFRVDSRKRSSRCRPLFISAKSAAETSRDRPKDFITRVVEENPCQVEPRFRVGDKVLTSRDKNGLARKNTEGGDPELASKPGSRPAGEASVGGDAATGEKPVYLNNVLREFEGNLYVPEQLLETTHSEAQEFDKTFRELPRLKESDFVAYLRTDKIKLLTSKPRLGGFSSDIIVDLKETPGAKSLQVTKWAINLKSDVARNLLDEYTGPRCEVETYLSHVGQLTEYPSPVPPSIARRIVAELTVVTAVLAIPALVVGSFTGWVVSIVALFLYEKAQEVIWPFAKSLLILLLGTVWNTAERLLENIVDIFTAGGILSKFQEFCTFGGVYPTLRMLRPIMLVFTIMVVLIRFTLTRRPKNFNKWDIWQGIEFSQSKPQARVDGSTGVLFSDVAGIDEAVAELQELVEYLKNPKLFDEKGIKPPHGVLLEGPPGCGKTLIAKAIAGEAGVPFYQMAGTEFVDILVGVGSARVRDLFKRAKVNKPSVIFIDEIDALATRREGIFNESTNNLYAGTQERETTLNQLLIELDGFDTGKGVIFLSATNRMDLLDPALLRPGRFDRKIRIRPPGAKGRLDILRVHASKVKLSPSVDLSTYAQNLPGWTGAKLAQLLQEAALAAVRNGHESILNSDLDDAVDRLTVGPRCIGVELGHQGQSRRAATEVGVAMTSHLLRRYENAEIESCERISINPRGQKNSQIVFHRLDDEAYILERRPQLLHRLQVLLGGRAAEEVIHGQDTSRASIDYLADASWLARKILTIWNLENPMTIRGEPPCWTKSVSFVGPRLDFEGSLYDCYGLVERPLNPSLEDQVARRAEELIQDLYKKTLSLLKRHQAALIKTVKVLLYRKEIRGDHIEYIISAYPAQTPLSLVLEEKNPEWLPIFDSMKESDKVLSYSQPTEFS